MAIKITCWLRGDAVDWLKDQRGATAMEYALIAGGFGAATMAATFFLGNEIENVLNGLGSAIHNVQVNAESSS